jgi:hypothetical protein
MGETHKLSSILPGAYAYAMPAVQARVDVVGEHVEQPSVAITEAQPGRG